MLQRLVKYLRKSYSEPLFLRNRDAYCESTEMNRWRIVKDKIENPLKDVWKIYTQTKSQVQQVSSIHNNFTVTLY